MVIKIHRIKIYIMIEIIFCFVFFTIRIDPIYHPLNKQLRFRDKTSRVISTKTILSILKFFECSEKRITEWQVRPLLLLCIILNGEVLFFTIYCSCKMWLSLNCRTWNHTHVFIKNSTVYMFIIIFFCIFATYISRLYSDRVWHKGNTDFRRYRQ